MPSGASNPRFIREPPSVATWCLQLYRVPSGGRWRACGGHVFVKRIKRRCRGAHVLQQLCILHPFPTPSTTPWSRHSNSRTSKFPPRDLGECASSWTPLTESAMSFSKIYGPADDKESLQTLAKAVELGCTFWDTAVVYGVGHNESLIGEFVQKNKCRDKVFIASKCGFAVSQRCQPSAKRRIGYSYPMPTLLTVSVWARTPPNATSRTTPPTLQSTLRGPRIAWARTPTCTICIVLTRIPRSKSRSLRSTHSRSRARQSTLA